MPLQNVRSSQDMDKYIQVNTSEGRLQGVIEDGLAVFRGVPFARPPTGSLRFQAPVLPLPRSELLDATRPAAMCPQTDLRLKAMGPFHGPQDEDCLTMTIWAPLPLNQPKAALVFLHGGALSSGGCSHPWYDGATLARSHDIVVINPNYRLGALGFLCRPGLSPGNMGFLDQIQALEWIQANVASFGGDPRQVTLMGQSAGATSICLMLAKANTRPLFSRAILLSGGFLSFKLKSAESATEEAHRFCEALGINPQDPEALSALQEVPVAMILEAQKAVTRESKRATGDVLPTFMYATTNVFPSPADLEGAIREGAMQIDALVGTTADEFNAFIDIDERLKDLSSDDVPPVAAGLFGNDWEELIVHAQSIRSDPTPTQIVTDALTENFTRPIRKLAACVSEGRGSGWCFRLDWSPPESIYGACHCIDLPFVFGNFDAFIEAPMLAGGDVEEMRALSSVLRSAISQFVKQGSPVHSELTGWQPYISSLPAVMIFNVERDYKDIL